MGKDIKDYMDDIGFIGNKKKEGGLEFGDSVQRTFTKAIVDFLQENGRPKDNLAKDLFQRYNAVLFNAYQSDTNTIERQPMRHHDSKNWPGQPWTMSRDNFRPLWMAMVLHSGKDFKLDAALDGLTKDLDQRKGLLWNYKHIWPSPTDEPKLPDVLMPWDRSVMRARRRKSFLDQVVCHVYDLDPLLNSIIIVAKSYRNPTDTSSDLNHQVQLVFNSATVPTVTNWFAKKIYKLRRNPLPKSQREFLAKDVYTSYFNQPEAPPMNDVWASIAKKYL